MSVAQGELIKDQAYALYYVAQIVVVDRRLLLGYTQECINNSNLPFNVNDVIGQRFRDVAFMSRPYCLLICIEMSEKVGVTIGAQVCHRSRVHCMLTAGLTLKEPRRGEKSFSFPDLFYCNKRMQALRCTYSNLTQGLWCMGYKRTRKVLIVYRRKLQKQFEY